MTITRRDLLAGAAATAGATILLPACAQAAAEVLTPEMFGAKGNGVTNDTEAFQAMATAISLRGGGTVSLRKTTYLVGKQTLGVDPAGWAYPTADVMDFRNLRTPLVFRGNGARLKCAAGLRYGLFDRKTGRPFIRPLPYYEGRELASPYVAMIRIRGCRAPITLSDLELDGSLAKLRIGGPYGDTGHQIPAIGLFLEDNLATETIRNLYTHHHGQDGLEINGDDRRRARSRLENVVSEYNGRQGCSIIGGRGYDFVRCKFNHTGRSAVQSAPGAGVDIEAEGVKIVRDLTFTDCEFSNNVGCGLLAEAGDGEGAVFTHCTFIGTTSWSAWPRKPRMVFRDSTFVGSAVNAQPHANPALAAQFHGCRFRDDPRLSPTGRVYGGEGKGHPIVDMGASDNVLFSRCSFVMTHAGRLPWSWRATYADCTMVQKSRETAYPKGKYLGRSTISAPADLYNSKVIGTLILNGKPVDKGLRGGEPW